MSEQPNIGTFIRNQRVGARLTAWEGISGSPALVKAAGETEGKVMVDNKMRGCECVLCCADDRQLTQFSGA